MSGLASQSGADLEAVEDLRLAINEACQYLISDHASRVELSFTIAAENLELDAVAFCDGDPEPPGEPSELSRLILEALTDRFEIEMTPSGPALHLMKKWRLRSS